MENMTAVTFMLPQRGVIISLKLGRRPLSQRAEMIDTAAEKNDKNHRREGSHLRYQMHQRERARI
jgi:hypothetical protein